jgi:AcrR family transcriptional regulator
MASSTKTPRASAARERLLEAGSELFYREGIHSIGVDRIVGAADVTLATFYRHFGGKEALVEAYLGDQDAQIRAVFAAAGEQSQDPKRLLELLIDGLADDITRNHTRGCPFINASAEYPDAASPVRQTVAHHRAWFRGTLVELLTAAGAPDPEDAAAQLVLLRDAAMVGGYLDGAKRVGETFVRAARRVAGLD